MNEQLYIGLMSGTSVDGIDAALVSISSESSLKVIDTLFTPFSNSLREEINTLAQTNWNLHNKSFTECSDSPLHKRLADDYANASLALLNKANIKASKICAIANHGQTVRHEPNASPAYSLQLGDPQLIANKTRIRTIGQFRQADLAVGGQGAPLMPAFHQAVFSLKKNESSKAIFVLNIGGIANISQLGNHVIGFDTGPGNTLLDQWILRHKNKSYDQDGSWAATGQIIEELLKALLNDPYFSTPFPKSTGPDYFNLKWLQQYCKETGINLDNHAPEDVQATLLRLTVITISDCIDELITENTTSAQIYVCGGGAHNSAMLEELTRTLPQCSIKTTSAVGIPADWVEAAGFAWLGYCNVNNIESNLPDVTGARKKVILGQSFMPSKT